jgi:hypothetical protein
MTRARAISLRALSNATEIRSVRVCLSALVSHRETRDGDPFDLTLFFVVSRLIKPARLAAFRIERSPFRRAFIRSPRPF